MASELREIIPTFGDEAKTESQDVGISDWSALTSTSIAKNWGEVGLIVVVAFLVVGGLEAWCRLADIPTYTFPRPSLIGSALFHNFRPIYAHHLWVTAQLLFLGYAIGASIGIVLAAI